MTYSESTYAIGDTLKYKVAIGSDSDPIPANSTLIFEVNHAPYRFDSASSAWSIILGPSWGSWEIGEELLDDERTVRYTVVNSSSSDRTLNLETSGLVVIEDAHTRIANHRPPAIRLESLNAFFCGEIKELDSDGHSFQVEIHSAALLPAKVMISDLSGRVLYHGELRKKRQIFFLPDAPNLYVISVRTLKGDCNLLKKIVRRP
ncbi:MAG: hypothetical protein AAF998_02145 [Bacteroidota bacterium]